MFLSRVYDKSISVSLVWLRFGFLRHESLYTTRTFRLYCATYTNSEQRYLPLLFAASMMECIDKQIQYLNNEVHELESKLEEVERQIGDKANKKRVVVLRERRNRLMEDKRLLLSERRALVEKLSGEASAANAPTGTGAWSLMELMRFASRLAQQASSVHA
ncbi:hypothetical protein Vafri_18012 [Volvox africanus]|uniref:Uncharacterized protein n=1 Tax=Volvox africanus TaxID=51714 RepID=A0A8J4F776_9CHLO|nr:hypothetical protein Vafri_18012 [Volvox africanus]